MKKPLDSLKSVGIIGYGVTTKPLVRLLRRSGIECKIFDDKRDCQEDFVSSLQFESDLESFDAVITSPGIPPSHPLISLAQARSRLLSEYDFFYLLMQRFQRDILQVWISGTNGKTTTTQMLEFLLSSQGARSGGNIGRALAELFDSKEGWEVLQEVGRCHEKMQSQAPCAPIWILETSSFMLHYTHIASPKLYVLLPVFEDHISWHAGFENYAAAKLSVLARMEAGTFALLPWNLQDHALVRQARAQIYFYKDSKDLDAAFDLGLEKSIFEEPFLLDAALALSAQKLLFNQAGTIFLNQFQIGGHRMEEFLDSKGRLWVDDSKGTNVDASRAAILRYEKCRHLHLILGGDDKGARLDSLFEQMRTLKTSLTIYAIGSNAKRLEALAGEFGLHCEVCGFLQEAVMRIDLRLKVGEVALLSPAAASLDQFSSYKQRGEEFRALAQGGLL